MIGTTIDDAWLLDRLIARMRRFASDRIEEDVRDWIRSLSERQDEFGFDPFGFQPEFLELILPIAQWLYRGYFRAETVGIDNVPDGRVLIVSNHSGQIPIDGLVIVASCVFDRKPPRMLRSMVEKWVPTLPFISYVFARCGQVVGTPDNCRVLLERDDGILVFPEGVRGISKTFDKRYRLEPFGLGFMRLALESDTPIVPLAVIGAEEQAPSLLNARRIAKVLGMPSFPVTPTFPWLGPAGLLPLPVKYRLYFGEPMTFEGDPDDEDAAVAQRVERVRQAIQVLIDQGLKERTSVFF